jgi:hypothetical protein
VRFKVPVKMSDMRALLKVAIFDAGGQKAWAEANGVSPQYVCDALQGRRDIGESIAKAFKLVPITLYVPADDLQKWQ